MNKAGVVSALGAGAGVGLVIGIVMGLSNSPVVGIILGSLSAGLLALLGLSGGKDDIASSARIASFGFTCVVGIILGIAMRTHSWLSPTPSEELARWTAVRFSDDEARRLVLFERIGILPKEWSLVAQQPNTPLSSFLFASTSSDDCGYLTSVRYPQVADQIKKFVDKGGEFAKFGVIVQQLPARPISRPSSTRLSISGARNDRAKTREYTHCHPRSGIVSIMGRTF